MGVKITLEGVNVRDNASVLNHARVHATDAEISLRNMTVEGRARVLEKLDIEDFCGKAQQQVLLMDQSSPEYGHIRKLLRQDRSNESSFLKQLLKHLGSFSEGVLASIVASMLFK